MSSRYWLVMPAAGAGRRVGGATAKQYLSLLNQTVIEWALQPFIDDARCKAVIVVLAANDEHWHKLQLAAQPKIRITRGGDTRADSVRAGLAALPVEVKADDWVLVHDAARPCLQVADLNSLLESLHADAIGGLLATPLADTLKRADGEQRADQTIPRDSLWRALTPQMFRYELLQRALNNAFMQGLIITDEAAAVEALGCKPRLINGRADNLKITVAEDLALAAHILAAYQAEKK
jgi:2-C-methyl-D-erythritol 4-phosphate cytidylyltransferase